MLYYSVVEASYTKGLVVIDKFGTLIYAALGADEKLLVLAMQQDFKKYNKKLQLGAVQALASNQQLRENEKINKTIEQYRDIMENPALSPSAINLKYKLIGGTALQFKVWDYLENNTTALQTTTYGNIAKHFGMSSYLSRAIGNACGANKIAIVVPCHRVLGHKGDITGYKWGVDVKREILKRENATK